MFLALWISVAWSVDSAAGITDERLRNVVREHWEERLRADPIGATQLGDHRFDDRLADLGGASLEQERRVRRDLLERARKVPGDELDENDRLTRALLVERLMSDVAVEACRFEHWRVGPRFNAWGVLADLVSSHPVHDATSASSFLARVEAWPAYVAQETANLRLGVHEGWVAPAGAVERTLTLLDAAIGTRAAAWPFSDPDDALAPEVVQRQIRRDVLRVAERAVRPALVRYRNFLAEEVLPVARTGADEGISALPGGSSCYAALSRQHTTLPQDADALHQLGLTEMAKIHSAFRTLGVATFKTDDLARIFKRLREDSELRFDTSLEVQEEASRALAAANAEVPHWFGRLPKTECVVEPMPDWEAPWSTIAYYRPAVPDGSVPGTYVINTFAPETRPRAEAPALAFHEAVPGHHFQVSLAQELAELPAFRRFDGVTAFVEGWALYTEALADEMGLYRTDVERLGMWSFDAWRAARLVVDTGIHAKGWTRQQAIDWMAINTPLALNNIENEVDRYVSWPGQALGYKVGQVEIRALRAEAEETLGDRFDICGFHDTLLGAGAVSLPVLRTRVGDWVRIQAARAVDDDSRACAL